MTSTAHDTAAGRLVPACQHVEQRRLANAVATDNRDPLASQVKIQVANERAATGRLDRDGVGLEQRGGVHGVLLRQARASCSTIEGAPSIRNCVPRGVAWLRRTRHCA